MKYLLEACTSVWMLQLVAEAIAHSFLLTLCFLINSCFGELFFLPLQLLVPSNISGVCCRHTTELHKGYAEVFQTTSLVTLCFLLVTQCTKSIPFQN